jgi:hypothetical protein
MIRNLKTLGVALVAMAAFAALAASVAQASPVFNAETNLEWHSTGEQVEQFNHKLTLPFGAELTCKQAHFDPTYTYKGSTTKVRATPTYSECQAHISGSKFPITVTHNSCEYQFHATKKVPETSTTYEGDIELICPEGVKGIEIHIYSDEKHESVRCTFTIKPQLISGILTHNEATDVKVTTNTAKVIASKTSGSLLQCGSSEQTAEYHGDATTTATNSEGKSVNSFIEGS